MILRIRLPLFTASFFAAALICGGDATAATITGSVKDASGQSAPGATVLVYSAGVRKGYSTFCPTCYVDCGKRATTDANGEFTIVDLDEELVFNLIVLREGQIPTWVRGVDPQKGAAPAAVLKPRPAIATARSVSGRIVDTKGNPVPDAVVQIIALLHGASGRFGSFPDGLAVSNAQGEFEVSANDERPGEPLTGMMVEVRPRGLAPTLYTAQLSRAGHEIKVVDGATATGRLIFRGKPVANAQLVMTTLTRAAGSTYGPMYIGTDAKGRFAMTNLPVGRVWSLQVSSDSLSKPGVIEPRYLSTRHDGEVVDVGDVVLRSGYTVSGRVVLSDGQLVPADMRLTLANDVGFQTVMLPPDGRFEIKGLKGAYTTSPQVRGYRVPDGVYLETLVERDIRDLIITLDPAPTPTRPAAPLTR
jgi:hypothetical protein